MRTLERLCLLAAVVVGIVATARAGDGLVYLDAAGKIDARATEVEAILDRVGDWSSRGETTEQLLARIARENGLPIRLKRFAIEEEGIPLGMPHDFELPGVTLRRMLTLELSTRGLAIDHQGGAIVVTTHPRLDEMFYTDAYAVDDLMAWTPGDMTSLLNLTFLMTSSGWQAEDGVGGALLPLGDAGVLAIRQTEPVHREIRQIVAAMRAAHGLPPRPVYRIGVGTIRTSDEPAPVIRLRGEPDAAADPEIADLTSHPPSNLRPGTAPSPASWRQPRVHPAASVRPRAGH